MADRKTFGHQSCRVAACRQFLGPPNMISVRFRRLSYSTRQVIEQSAVISEDGTDRVKRARFPVAMMTHVSEIWRRVPESNRSSRICNPSHSTENIEGDGKRSRFVHGSKSDTYGPDVNGGTGAENDNPGALAGATGAEFEAGNFKAKPYRNPGVSSNRKSGSIIARAIAPQHKQMSRLLGYSLLLGTPETWQSFGLIAAVRLTAQERAFIAAVVLATLDPDTVEDIAATAVDAAGTPLPPFLGGREDARSWASWASRSELKAYALACFEAMPPKDQAAFYSHIGTVEVAA